jgi:hypothetical protein
MEEGIAIESIGVGNLAKQADHHDSEAEEHEI